MTASPRWQWQRRCLAGVLAAALATAMASVYMRMPRWARGVVRCDWWEPCAGAQPRFNKSVLYVKPHKTGSESFKSLLKRVADHYGLSTDAPTQTLSEVDVLVRHRSYRAGATEKLLRGWGEGREVVRVVTIRDPVERVFSRYFSMRRFKSWQPSHGGLSNLTREEELRDFDEWLNEYPHSQLTKYLMDVDGGQGNMGRIGRIVELYEHVVVAEEWRVSVCLFGFRERIAPSLLDEKRRNVNKGRALRFDVEWALRVDGVLDRVLAKIEYDAVLYRRLFGIFESSLREVLKERGEEFARYCAAVGK